ncbi:hypothetical protein IDJ75_13165 [Mucilaginibacter rigui]|uniref:Oligosaccharide repeat unit polymerase n=1 Tax=Mucilaginibacter rigui TaxID=534635 RepID=A0ABR7X6L5_9SPHI|nr:hypothetical protein [Mucilaginibacter rigui]MBD1386229.1 hypothetical protein [Mucilaginibacter rigui]
MITFGMFGGSFKVDITSKAASFVAPYLNPNMLIERFVIFFNVSFTYFIINYLKGKRGSIWLYMLSAAVSFYLILGIVSRNSILSIVIYVLLIVLYFVKGKNIFSTKSIDVSANKKQNVRVRKNVFIMLSVVVAIIAYNYIFLSIFQAKSISRNGETSIFDNSRLVIYKAVLTEAVSSVKVFFFGKGIGNSATQISGAYSDFDFFNRDADTFGAFNTVLGWQLELGVIFTVYFIYWLFKTCKNTPAPLYLKLLLLCTFIPGMFESLTFGNYSWFPELFKWVLISVIYNWDILPLKSRIKFVLS